MNNKTNPEHYQFAGVEVIQITQYLDFLLGNVVKYSARAGRKEGESKLDDLQKAQWYITKAIQLEIKHNEEQQTASQNYRHIP
jgi:hypothetical protein